METYFEVTDSETAGFLLEFQRLLPLTKTPRTLLEIARFPRSELACSNILAFFLDPNEEHGLGDIVLNSLLEATEHDEQCINHHLESVEVKREDRTDSNKRIDIVVVGDDFVLGIENKIDANVDNPFDEYEKWLQGRAGQSKRVLKILLSLKPEAEKSGFIPITYDSFFAVLEKRLGQRILSADQRYLTHLIDFMNTIKNLTKGSHMDERFIAFVRNYHTNAFKFYLALERDLRSELKSRIESVTDSIELPPTRFERLTFDDAWLSKNGQNEFYAANSSNVDVGGGLVLELSVSLLLSEGWIIGIWGGKFDKLGQWLNKNRIKLKAKNDDPTNKWQVYAKFEYKTDAAVVCAEFQKLINNVSAAIKKK